MNDIDKELAKRDTYQGFNLSILNRSKQIISNLVKKNDIVVDATIGNGNDTLFLADLAREGKVIGFDIQKEAIERTKKLLDKNSIKNYQLFEKNHADILKVLKNYENKISLILFNLGYLPNGDKSITTNYKTTIKAINDSLKLLNNKGNILVVIYPGHNAGLLESKEIKKYLKTNNIKYKEYHNTNNEIAPYLIQIKK